MGKTRLIASVGVLVGGGLAVAYLAYALKSSPGADIYFRGAIYTAAVFVWSAIWTYISISREKK